MAARKCLDFIFTQGELYWLDHLLPEEHRRQKEDADKALEEGDAVRNLSSDSVGPTNHFVVRPTHRYQNRHYQ